MQWEGILGNWTEPQLLYSQQLSSSCREMRERDQIPRKGKAKAKREGKVVEWEKREGIWLNKKQGKMLGAIYE